MATRVLSDLSPLHAVLVEAGYTVVGPTVRDGAIVLDELSSAEELPFGWGVTLQPGGYRVRRRDDDAAFAHSAGPQSWKPFLHPTRVKLWEATRSRAPAGTGGSANGAGPEPRPEPRPEPADSASTEASTGASAAAPATTVDFAAGPVTEEPPRYAFLGVRPCDLSAIRIQDRILMGGRHASPTYEGRRRGTFIIAVNCTEPGETCFCTSMGTGPEAGPGYDLALTELVDDDGHRFVVDVGSEEGEAMLARLPETPPPAEPRTEGAARAAVAAAADRMGRSMPAGRLHELMAGSLDAERWNEVSQRCLTCGNCTMVCPTCFCTTVEEVTDVTGDHAERWQLWDSCFDLDFSNLHGGSVRATPQSRYRQWLTHKLGTWHDQFGSSGCVGCGRCIVWCPVGIDITEEVAALSAEAAARTAAEQVGAETAEADAQAVRSGADR